MARNKSEVSYKLKIDFKGIKDPSIKEKIKEDVGDFLVEETLKHVGEGKTPVKKGTYRKTLTKGYKKEKKNVSSVTFANMELTGEMLDELKAEPTKSGVEIAIKGKEAAKAYGHHTSFRGHKTIKNRKKYKREFIPTQKQGYKRNILSEVKKIVEQYEDEEVE